MEQAETERPRSGLKRSRSLSPGKPLASMKRSASFRNDLSSLALQLSPVPLQRSGLSGCLDDINLEIGAASLDEAPTENSQAQVETGAPSEALERAESVEGSEEGL
jgi:hypothetical protein